MAFGVTSTGWAQGTTTSAISGRVVDTNGDAVPSASVTITQTRTNASFSTTSGPNGRFTVGGLQVGGPYSVVATAEGFVAGVTNNIYLDLSQTYRVTLTLPYADAFELDELSVTAGPTTIFDSNEFGAGSIVDAAAVQSTPSINENIADIARLNPLVAIMDPERLEISAAGQHYRQNSVQVDGVNLNDQFGLEASGLPSLLNPFALRSIAQFNVSISPYDVRNSGFTGASINAVTKSGSNEFEGEVYYYYSDDSLRADNYFSGDRSAYESQTYGINLGGPILKDRLFFFVNYEKAEIEREASNPGFIPDASEVERLRNYLMNLSTTAYPNGYDPGTWGSVSAVKLEDEKYLAKVDWVITDDHRLTVRYSQTEGTEPLFGEYSDFGETSLTSHYYSNEYKNTALSAQINSRWSDMLETEFVYARDTFDKTPTYANPNLFPEIIIDQFPGTNLQGDPITNGELFFGSEDSRQANDLGTETNKGKGVATIYLGEHTLVTGFDYEKTEFDNLFLQDVYGNIEYDTLDQLINNIPIEANFNSRTAFMNRNAGVQGETIAAQSDYADLGLFIQDEWQINSQLQILFGVRYDTFSTDQNPARNDLFNSTFTTQSGETGFDNTNTIDGTDNFSFRAAFRYDFDTTNRQQLRGGFGLFQGRVPGVYMSNAFSNNGSTTSAIRYEPSITLTDYLNNEFDPANPIEYVVTPQGSQVDLIDEDFELPAVWRGNLAYDILIPNTDWTFTVEGVLTFVEKGVLVENLNLEQDTANPLTPDGRAYYTGDEFDSNFGDVFNLTNTDKGRSANLSFEFSRPLIDNWSASVSYTYGESEDVSSVTSSTAFSNYANRAIFNANEDATGTSNYQTRHRVLAQAKYVIDWSERTSTGISLIYEGRSGRPYSFIFDNDYNNDGISYNDLFYVPSGPNDPMIGFAAGTTQAEIDEFFDFIDSTNGLREYAGGAVKRNSATSKWVNRLDIRLSQDIVLYNDLELELWVSVQNFLNLLNDEWGQTREVSFSYTAAVAEGEWDQASNKIIYDLGNSPEGPQIDVDRNYAISVGAALKF
jgi:outer membrane receptor for ferrienterochelin and colicin